MAILPLAAVTALATFATNMFDVLPLAAADHQLARVGPECDEVGDPLVVDMVNPGFFFDPADVEIDVGQVVRWEHVGMAPITHTTTSIIIEETQIISLWESGQLANGQHFEVQFCAVDTYDYWCQNHVGMGMAGTVTVT